MTSYATFLSRKTWADWPEVSKAKAKLQSIGYPYQTEWVNAGEECGWGSNYTPDEYMLAEVFGK
jgi:hypothetical protein